MSAQAEKRADVVIIGAGPAGMACAIEAAQAGLSVVVLDENPAPGGQIYRAVETATPTRLRVLGDDYAKGRDLVAAFRATAGIDYRPNSTVWNITSERLVEYSCNGRSTNLRAGHLVVASARWSGPVRCRAGRCRGLARRGLCKSC